jgi:hypothetical protein
MRLLSAGSSNCGSDLRSARNTVISPGPGVMPDNVGASSRAEFLSLGTEPLIQFLHRI